uniref:Uncharacterized protein n=1 Tax=Candidatus Kentrum sp. LPFa TaxID=2126335 RepID=A0A450XYM3_9GAMM|nr:MAG: hypothetical protein BECKLPF1236A_GA0070988_102616 [Candidatus Kentron sp. LPFa]VFK34394.1 MAG: hypothetical protein BECKLPF1236C_GA0070990_102665 [Candidatus Kentron sp. LPFa]
MSKSEELKERIGYLKGFLTILFGIIVLMCGGLANLYLKDQINEIFWLGIGAIIAIIFMCFGLMSRIERHLKKLGET